MLNVILSPIYGLHFDIIIILHIHEASANVADARFLFDCNFIKLIYCIIDIQRFYVILEIYSPKIESSSQFLIWIFAHIHNELHFIYIKIA